MLRKFVRNTAVKSWQRELDEFLEVFESQPRTKQADYFIFGVRTRAGMQIEGLFTFPDGTINTSPDLMAYPIMLDQFQRLIQSFEKKGNSTEAACVSIWAHTVRAFMYPELRPSADRMWGTIMQTKDLWPEMLKHHYKLDVADGIDKDQLKATYELAVDILKRTPPEVDNA